MFDHHVLERHTISISFAILQGAQQFEVFRGETIPI